MRKITAAAGTAGFAVVAPGFVAGVAPWLMTSWHEGRPGYPLPVEIAGGVLLAAGAGVLIYAFAQFALQGLGTPAPVAPPKTLVVRGLYRYVRNPMYMAVVAAIAGQGILLGRPVLIGYAAGIAAFFASFVYLLEQPALTRRYGAQYQAYRRDVPGWWPRLRPRESPSD